MFKRYNCTYCGDKYAEDLDHVIPVSINEVSRKTAKWSKTHVVPSCKECNNALSDKYLTTVWQRARFIQERLEKKYKKAFKTPEWDEEDLKELSPKLRKEIKNDLALKRLHIYRVKFAELVADSFIEIEDVWDAIALDEESP